MRIQHAWFLSASVLLLGWTGASARPGQSPADLASATQLYQRAVNIRQLRDPLLQRRARRQIDGMLGKLEAIGIQAAKVPIRLNSKREYRLLRQASKLLRGARPGTEAYALRRQVVQRAWSLHRSILHLPNDVQGYTHTANGGLELVINVDSLFWSRPVELFTVLAHELRHVRDVRRGRRLTRERQRLLKETSPSDRRPRQLRRLGAMIRSLRSTPEAESRAFAAQAEATGKAGLPLGGTWWRAPDGSPIDRLYPPARLNHQLIRGYLRGVRANLAPAVDEASPTQMALVERYLAGYRSVLASQAVAYYKAKRSGDRRDPAAIVRYHAAADELLAQPEAQPGARVATGPAAFAAGRAAAYRGEPPQPGALALLGACR